MNQEYKKTSHEFIKILKELNQSSQKIDLKNLTQEIKKNKYFQNLIMQSFNEKDTKINQKEFELEKTIKNYEDSLSDVLNQLCSLDILAQYDWHRVLSDLKKKGELKKNISLSYAKELVLNMQNEKFHNMIEKEEQSTINEKDDKESLFKKELEQYEIEKIKETLFIELQHLIIEINLPEYSTIQSKATTLLEKVKTNFDLNLIAEYLQEIIHLVQELKYQFQRKRDILDDFIQEILANLFQSENTFFTQMLRNTQKVQSSNQTFHDFLEKNIGTLSTKVHTIDEIQDLKDIKDEIETSLKQIQNKAEEKLKADNEEFKNMQKEVIKLREELSGANLELQKIKDKTKEMEKEILTDGLTGIYNRRAFDNKISEIIKLHKRYQTEYCLILFDIDFFIKINDSFGHRIGDKAMLHITNVIEKNLRESDFFARYGGEEFAVILNEIDIDYAFKVANKIRKTIEKTKFTYQKTNKISMTISAGVSKIKTDDSYDSFINRADKALYLAKESGRNQVKTENDL